MFSFPSLSLLSSMYVCVTIKTVCVCECMAVVEDVVSTVTILHFTKTTTIRTQPTTQQYWEERERERDSWRVKTHSHRHIHKQHKITQAQATQRTGLCLWLSFSSCFALSIISFPLLFFLLSLPSSQFLSLYSSAGREKKEIGRNGLSVRGESEENSGSKKGESAESVQFVSRLHCSFFSE